MVINRWLFRCRSIRIFFQNINSQSNLSIGICEDFSQTEFNPNKAKKAGTCPYLSHRFTFIKIFVIMIIRRTKVGGQDYLQIDIKTLLFVYLDINTNYCQPLNCAFIKLQTHLINDQPLHVNHYE